MHDFDFDVMQKKRIAAGARHKVNGSRSKFVGLPSDNMTPAQLKKLNGPCKTYDLNGPMDWETFKSMPLDLQQSDLNGLSSRFNVTQSAIGQDLFGLSRTGLIAHVKRSGLSNSGGSKLNASQRKIWEDWLQQETPLEKGDEEEPGLEEIDACEPIEVPMAIPEEEPGLRVSDLTATFTGKFEPEKFMKWVAMLPMPEGKVKIRVSVREEDYE